MDATDDSSPQLATLAGALADRTRASFCLALLDGRAWTAGELARHARVARSTASEHLDRLAAVGLIAEEHQGRHRYVRLADPEVGRTGRAPVGPGAASDATRITARGHRPGGTRSGPHVL